MVNLSGLVAKLFALALSAWFAAKSNTTTKVSEFSGQGKLSLELGARVGGLYGDMVDQEEWYYDHIGMQVREDDGRWHAVSASVSGVGFELNGWLNHSPTLRVGFGLEMEAYRIHPYHQNANVFDRALLSRQDYLLKMRFLPFLVSGVRIGLEAGAGLAMGTVRRYSLAMVDDSNLSNGVVRRAYSNYSSDGNRPLSLVGTRMGFGPVVVLPINNQVGIVAKGDFQWTAWRASQSDPLRRYATPAYPGPSEGMGTQGADFVLLISATF